MIAGKGKVFIKFNGQIEELAKHLSKSLSLPDFGFKNDQDYPHELTAMSECLGFETWLYPSGDFEEYNFTFEICSTVDVKDITTTEYTDLSEWLSKTIRLFCEVETTFTIK